MEGNGMGEQYLNPHQSVSGAPSEYDMKLAGAIEEIFGRNVHDLPGLLDGLNSANVVAPDGQPWTEQSLTAHLRTLGG
jgi:hypothetical protein